MSYYIIQCIVVAVVVVCVAIGTFTIDSRPVGVGTLLLASKNIWSQAPSPICTLVWHWIIVYQHCRRCVECIGGPCGHPESHTL